MKRKNTSWGKRLVETVFATRLGTWLILNVATHTDPLLLKLSGGRFSSGSLMGYRVLHLTTVGAKSGKRRSVALIYFSEGKNIVVVASRGGHKRHPGWYHNLRAHPEAAVLCGDRSGEYMPASIPTRNGPVTGKSR